MRGFTKMIKDYIKDGKIKCLVCGKYFRRPLSHVWQKHEMSAREYKSEYGLDLKKGIVTEDYREVMRQHVFENGTVNNLKKGDIYRFKKGHSINYKRSAETIERLKVHFTRIAKRTGREPTPKIEILCAECGKKKMIYPRYYQKNNNFCGVKCRNINNNKKRK